MPLGDTLSPLVSDPIRVRINIFRDRLAGPDSANEVGNLAYEFFVKLFEAGGEHNRRPDGSPVMVGNGHHAAQKMAEVVKAEWESRLRPMADSAAPKALTDMRADMQRDLAAATDPRLKANISRELEALEYEIARIGALQ